MFTNRFLPIVLFLVCLLTHTKAQEQCAGSLGENLFENGDFGSGEDQILMDDPGIAPGYQYTTNVPPFDGYYTITNNSNWNDKFGTWQCIPDNSNDPNGYMMVVNASFDAGIFFEQTVDGLCDNTLYDFSADIINIVSRTATGHSNPDISFLINDEVRLNTGLIRQDEQWYSYGFTFSTQPGETSVKLTLRNNAPGGVGNDLALDNISFRPCGPPSEISSTIENNALICQENADVIFTAITDGQEDTNRVYQWQISLDNGTEWTDIINNQSAQWTNNYTDPGDYLLRFKSANSEASFANEKCRFISEIFSFSIPLREYMLRDTICGGTGIPFGNDVINTPGDYVLDLISSQGCDSIVFLTLDTVRREVLMGDFSAQDPSCFGYDDGWIMVENLTGGYPPYHIEVDNQIYPSTTASELLAGNYQVLGADRFGCFTSQQTRLIDPQELILDIDNQEDSIRIGKVIDLSFDSDFDVFDFSAAYANAILCDPCVRDTSFIPLSSGTLVINAMDELGCPGSDSLQLIIDDTIDFYVPNIFSLSANNNINDRFRIFPYENSIVQVSELKIFDRWGSEIFSKENFDPKDEEIYWDGIVDGYRVSPGLYIVSATLDLITQKTRRYTGTLTVVE